jgi:hypothetical protein
LVFVLIAVLLTELLVVAALRNSPGREGISRILLWMVIWTFVIPAIGLLLVGSCYVFNGGKMFGALLVEACIALYGGKMW